MGRFATGCSPRHLLAPLVGALVTLLCVFVTMELGLRLAPQAVPLKLLAEYPDGLRAAIARGRPVPLRAEMRSLARDDGGPELLVFRPSADIRMYAPDPGMVGEVHLDSEGFCNPLSDEEQDARIVVVGDSFVFCTTVRAEDTWSAALARRFHVRTQNHGVPRLGLYEYLQVLKRYGLSERPQIVVMNVYEGNDLRDAVLYWEARARGRAGPQVGAHSPGVVSRSASALRASALGRHSYALSFAAAALLAWDRPPESSDLARQAGRRSREVDFRYWLDFGSTSVPFNPENADRNEVVYADLLERGSTNLDVFGSALEEFAALARENRFTPVLSYTPSAYTAYRDFVRFEDSALQPLLEGFSQRQRDYFAVQSARLGLAFIDFTEPLRTAAGSSRQRELLYFPGNLHLTPAGHRVIGSALGDFLVEHVEPGSGG